MKLLAVVILAACAAPQHPRAWSPSSDDTPTMSSDPAPTYDWQDAARRRDRDDDDRRRAEDYQQQQQQQQQQQNDQILQQQQQIYDQAQQ
jgi:hypothetical protein